MVSSSMGHLNGVWNHDEIFFLRAFKTMSLHTLPKKCHHRSFLVDSKASLALTERMLVVVAQQHNVGTFSVQGNSLT